MRTTLVLDDNLVREAKQMAIRLNVTLSEIVNRALREALMQRNDLAETSFRMITSGPDRPRVSHEPIDYHRALEDEEAASLNRG